jgi:ABC-type nitrate/sulfonate/bicarbonate transport system substrate-binding protein
LIKRLFAIAIVIVLTLLIGCTAAPAKPAEKTSLKFAVIPLLINLPGNVAVKEGLCEKQNLSVEIVSFRSTAEQESALLSGAVDGISAHFCHGYVK